MLRWRNTYKRHSISFHNFRPDCLSDKHRDWQRFLNASDETHRGELLSPLSVSLVQRVTAERPAWQVIQRGSEGRRVCVLKQERRFWALNTNKESLKEREIELQVCVCVCVRGDERARVCFWWFRQPDSSSVAAALRCVLSTGPKPVVPETAPSTHQTRQEQTPDARSTVTSLFAQTHIVYAINAPLFDQGVLDWITRSCLGLCLVRATE